MIGRARALWLVLTIGLLAGSVLRAQVSFERILRAEQTPQDWLTYSGGMLAQRHSRLSQITPANVKSLELQWVFQARSLEKFEATPLVVDGVMYTVQAPNDVVALDASTGRVFWVYSHIPSPLARLCCGRVNRGLAIHGQTLFMATIDGRLIALDAKSGAPRVEHSRGRRAPEAGYSLTVAPLVVKNMVIIGTAGGEYGVRGFLAAFDAGRPARKSGGSIPSRALANRPRDMVGRLVEDGWRLRLGDRLVRSGTQPDLLGHRQPGAGLEWRRDGSATTSTAIRSSRSMRIPAR